MRIKIVKMCKSPTFNEKYGTYSFTCDVQFHDGHYYNGLWIRTKNEQLAKTVKVNAMVNGEMVNDEKFTWCAFDLVDNKLTWHEIELMASRCYDIAETLNKEKPELLFDKILGVTSMQIDRDQLKGEEDE